MSAYGASKGAVASLLYGWAVDVQETGVRVDAIAPLGATRMMAEVDDFYEVRDSERGRFFEQTPPHEYDAPAVAYLLSGLSSGVHGQVLRVDRHQLALVTHPSIAVPTTFGGAATVATVQDAFDSTLQSNLQANGFSTQREVPLNSPGEVVGESSE